MRVKFSRRFEKRYNRAPKKIRKAFDSRLEIFIADKFHPTLNNHALIGKFAGYRSLNITGDWRAVFREMDSGERVYFDLIGSHSQLYK